MPNAMKMKAHSLIASLIGGTSPVLGSVPVAEGNAQDSHDRTKAEGEGRANSYYCSPNERYESPPSQGAMDRM